MPALVCFTSITPWYDLYCNIFNSILSVGLFGMFVDFLFPYEFLDILFGSKKGVIGILMGIELILHFTFGSIAIFTL